MDEASNITTHNSSGGPASVVPSSPYPTHHHYGFVLSVAGDATWAIVLVRNSPLQLFPHIFIFTFYVSY